MFKSNPTGLLSFQRLHQVFCVKTDLHDEYAVNNAIMVPEVKDIGVNAMIITSILGGGWVCFLIVYQGKQFSGVT